jgi:sugar transferase EpsL
MKRAFDILVSITALLILAPFFILISVSVFIVLGFPVIFSQLRPGLDSRPFRMYKFRTMTNEKDIDGKLLPNEKRITRFGRFLRATSLDEIPEFINVLKGEMSVVGPRPLLMDYVPLFNSMQNMRHSVKPGITGWAQVNGRNSITWEERFRLDVWYVKNHNICLDIKILWLTILRVFRREGVHHGQEQFMPRFKGND